MSPPDDQTFTECGNLRCTPQGLQFIQDRRVYREIPLEDIRRVTFRHGYVARHLVGQMIAASAMSLSGLLGFAALFSGIIRIGGGLAIFGLLGVWLFVDALKTGFVLRVEKNRGWDQCGFTPGTSQDAIARFLAESMERFGLPVESTEPVR